MYAWNNELVLVLDSFVLNKMYRLMEGWMDGRRDSVSLRSVFIVG